MKQKFKVVSVRVDTKTASELKKLVKRINTSMSAFTKALLTREVAAHKNTTVIDRENA